jgi:hypothetical protein
VLSNELSLNPLPILGKSHCPEPNQQSPASLERDTCCKLDAIKSGPLEGAIVGKRITDDNRCREVTGTGNSSTDEGHLQAITGSTWEPKYISMWKKIYPTDPNLSFAIDVAKHMKDEANKEFKYINEVLYRKGKICVPTEWDKEVIIEEFHDAPYAGHPGMAKTYKAIKARYWWPNM